MLRLFKWIAVSLPLFLPLLKWLWDNGFFNDWSTPVTTLACVALLAICMVVTNIGVFAVKFMGASFWTALWGPRSSRYSRRRRY